MKKLQAKHLTENFWAKLFGSENISLDVIDDKNFTISIPRTCWFGFKEGIPFVSFQAYNEQIFFTKFLEELDIDRKDVEFENRWRKAPYIVPDFKKGIKEWSI